MTRLISTSSIWLAIAAIVLSGAVSSGKERIRALPAIPPDGLIVFKRHQQPDDYAPVVEYTNAQFFSRVVNMKTKGGGYFSVQRGQMVYHIDYPSPNGDLLREVDLHGLRDRITEYGNISRRFKRTAPLLKPWIAKLRQELAMWEQGYGRTGGRWVNRASYVFDQDRARLREEFERKKARILASKKPRDVKTGHPPLWAEDLEAQLAVDQAQYREDFKNRIRQNEIERAEQFHRRREEGGSALSSSSGLDKAAGLDKSGPLGSRR